MSIVYQTNKKTGITYAYESTSVWIPELKQPRSKRKYLGRVDENGNIIPTTHKKGRKSSSSIPEDRFCDQPDQTTNQIDSDSLQEQVNRHAVRISELENEIRRLKDLIQQTVRSLSEGL